MMRGAAVQEVLMIAALLVLTIAFSEPPQAQPPRDPATPRTVVLQTANASAVQLAKQQEDSGAIADAEATLLKARAASPSSKDVVLALAAFYNRQGSFDKAIAALEDAAQLSPDDPQGYQIIATYYWEKAFKDHRLLPAEQYTYVMQGVGATDRALALKPDYMEALTYKNLLLRMQANLESDPALKQQLIAEADALRARAIELNKSRIAITGANQGMMLGPVPPPPPPPPPAPDGMAPLRVGGNIKVPTKIKDVRPEYPDAARAAGIQGVVILEAVIDAAGKVGSARVLRSIPDLDQAAVDAVRQWEFAPTLLNGAPVPVVMTVTVNFTLQ
jgi:TonB family protein